MDNIKRMAACVMLESDVLAFIDAMAEQNQKSRSFILNVIVRAFMKQQMQASKVEVREPVGTIRF